MNLQDAFEELFVFIFRFYYHVLLLFGVFYVLGALLNRLIMFLATSIFSFYLFFAMKDFVVIDFLEANELAQLINCLCNNGVSYYHRDESSVIIDLNHNDRETVLKCLSPFL